MLYSNEKDSIIYNASNPVLLSALTGKVIKVADGDTITILNPQKKQIKVRLYGIDAPEKKQAYGEKSRKFLDSMIAGKNVTNEEKEARAEDIAKNLSDNKKWHTHGRYINIKILQEDLKLKIENYTDKKEFRANIKEYMKLLKDHIIRLNRRIYFHTKLYK
ncbi:thermonuclease family protein [Campylobacter sp. MOP7]|uniref:thermonuclease family protein n=1 Tax=Campylobacter canis TaxID=3378588 RepID=UPI00387EA7C0